MSAAPMLLASMRPMILPHVWATASIANAAEAVRERKGPHCLRLVKPQEEPLWTLPTTVRVLQPEMAFYRKYTEAMLRRYATMSMEQGRVPSLLGRELFRGKVTNYKVQAFDDVVIFVHDMAKCLADLEPGLRYLVRRICVEGYTQEETAALSGLSLRTVTMKYVEALDKLTRMLLDRKMMEPMAAAKQQGIPPPVELPVENSVKGVEALHLV